MRVPSRRLIQAALRIAENGVLRERNAKLTAVEACPFTAYGDLERLELSPDLVHRVIQLLGFIFQLFHLGIGLEGTKSKWSKGQDDLYPRNPMGRSHKAFSPPRTHLQTADGTLRFFTVSQSYAEPTGENNEGNP